MNQNKTKMAEKKELIKSQFNWGLSNLFRVVGNKDTERFLKQEVKVLAEAYATQRVIEELTSWVVDYDGNFHEVIEITDVKLRIEELKQK